MDGLCVIREGSGPEVLLVHGGASARTTWKGLEPLATRWTLALVHRRGYPPSPSSPDIRHDFGLDASDLAPLLGSRPHVVAHSYGVLGTLIAASRAPNLVRSLTLIEPPLFYLVPDDPDVARLERIGDETLIHGLDADPAALREFLRLAGAPDVDDGPLTEEVARGFVGHTADAYPARRDRRLTSFAMPGSRRWWPQALIRPHWSASATLSRPSCVPSDSSHRVPVTSSRRLRASQIDSSSSSCHWIEGSQRARRWSA